MTIELSTLHSVPFKAHEITSIAATRMNIGHSRSEQGIRYPLSHSYLREKAISILIGAGAEIRTPIVGAGYSDFVSDYVTSF